VTVHDDEIKHFGLRKHEHGAGGDLPAKRLICAEQKLLSCLSTRVKRARNLRAAEGAVRERPAIFACERYALFDASIDD
jgi:hypothetical protein